MASSKLLIVLAIALQIVQLISNVNAGPISYQGNPNVQQHSSQVQMVNNNQNQVGYGQNNVNLDQNQNKYQHQLAKNVVGQSGQQQQQQQTQANFGIGNSGAGMAPGQNRFRGGSGVSGSGAGGNVNGGESVRGDVRLQLSGRPNENGRPNEYSTVPVAVQQPSQPQPAFGTPRPSTITSISFGTSQKAQGEPQFSSVQAQAQPGSSPSYYSGGGKTQPQGTFERQKGNENVNKFPTASQSNSNGLSVHNSNLPSTLAKNTFGMPVVNSWNTQSHLVNGHGQNVDNSNRYKVATLGNEQNVNQNLDNNFRNTNNGFKFPAENSQFGQGPINDGFSSNEITGRSPYQNQNTIKKGTFNWTSPDGDLYEITYTAASKSPPAVDNGMYNSSSYQSIPQAPRNNMQEPFGNSVSPSNIVNQHVQGPVMFRPQQQQHYSPTQFNY